MEHRERTGLSLGKSFIMTQKMKLNCLSMLVLWAGIGCKEDSEKNEAEQSILEEDTAEQSNSYQEPEISFAYYTQGFAGEAIVVPDARYDGIESVVRGLNEISGTGEIEEKLVWNLSGIPIEAPIECGNCQFAFMISAVFDSGASMDPNGVGLDATFSYALGQSDYGVSLFYLSNQGWFPWITHGETMTDFADVEYRETVSYDGSRFSYSDRIVDFYYYY